LQQSFRPGPADSVLLSALLADHQVQAEVPIDDVLECQTELNHNRLQRRKQRTWRQRDQPHVIAGMMSQVLALRFRDPPSIRPTDSPTSVEKNVHIPINSLEVRVISVDLPIHDKPHQFVSQRKELVDRRRIVVDRAEERGFDQKPRHQDRKGNCK
jgi:hypothetical protein